MLSFVPFLLFRVRFKEKVFLAVCVASPLSGCPRPRTASCRCVYPEPCVCTSIKNASKCVVPSMNHRDLSLAGGLARAGFPAVTV